MKNILKRVFAAVMAAAMLPVAQFSVTAAKSPELFLNESFDACASYDKPEQFDVNARNWWIQEYADKDKGLLMYAGLQGASYHAYAAGSPDTVISFDLKATDVMPNGEVKVTDGKAREFALLKFTEGRGAGAYNGLPISGFGKSKTMNYTLVFRADDRTCDIYINGKAKVQNMNLKGCSLSDVAKVTFTFTSSKDGQGVIVDNVNIYNSDTYVPMAYPRAEYNDEAFDEINPAFGPQVGSNTMFNETFDSGKTQLNAHTNGNNFKIVTDPTNPDNKVFMMERLATGDSHLNANGIATKTDYVVCEADIKVHEKMSVLAFNFKDTDNKEQGVVRLKAGYLLQTSNNSASKTLKPGQWYKVSILIDLYDRNFNVFVDGELFGVVPINPTFIGPGANLALFRLHMTHGVGGVTNEDPIKLEVDNLRVYESDKPIEGELGEIKKEIDVTAPGSIFASDKPQKNLMGGFMGFHGTSGVCYVDNQKVLLRTPTYIKDGVAMMPAKALADAFGFSCTENGANVVFNGVAIAGEVKNGIAYIPAPKAANAFGKTVVHVPSTYNAHMYVMGSQPIQLPVEQDDIDKLNDFLLYYRPDRNEFLKLYQESELAGVHPRIQFTQADFDRMVELSETDYWMKLWKERVIIACEGLVQTPLLIHELYDGIRLGKQRNMAKYMHVLAVGYHLTKDQRYLDRAYAELENFAKFPDWNPSHHLDTCEAMAGYAVGYDWLYHYFTEEQRKVIEEGMYKNGFYDSWLGFQSTGSKMGGAFNATNNHGNVDNSGALMGALAFIDVYPEVASYVGANSLKGAELCMYKWAPEGNWYEGAGYWELTMQFTAKWLDTLTTIWPETAGLGMHNLEGMNLAALSELQSQSPAGAYNFADAMPQRVLVPEMLYLANAYDLEGVYKQVIDPLKGKWADNEDLGLAMLLYEPERYESEVPMDIDYLLGRIDTIVMRDSWDTEEPVFVGIHGGHMESGHDQLDTGSFVYEYAGIRWSMEIGMGEYNSVGYWDWGVGGKRWNHYRSRAEAHSTIFTSPRATEDHNRNNTGKLTVHQLKPRGGIASIDMTDTLYDVTSATRGFAFVDNRQSLVIRDEIKFPAETEFVWTMITKADCEFVDGENKVILHQDGKSVEVSWTSTEELTPEFGGTKALPTSPAQTDNYIPGSHNMLRFTKKASGDFTLTVKLTPVDLRGLPTSVEEWDAPITSWSIPDGEIPAVPYIDTITVGDQVLSAGTKTNLEASIVEGVQDTAPQASASSDKYNVEIEQAATINDVIRVKVTDKNDPYNRRVYTVKFTCIKKPLDFPGMTSIPVMGYEVSEITQEANPPIHMFDNDQSTRYAVAGVDQWAILDLGSSQRFDNVMISFMSGHARQQKFNISVSDDGVSWVELWSGLSSGTTEDLETYAVTGAKGRYIRLGLDGNTSGGENWNSLTGVFITRNN